jgi:iron complex outermembrane receptor protein
VHGHVVEGTSHEPVSAAQVSVGGTPRGETDVNGHFLLDGLCPGDVEITVERIDCVPNTRTIQLGKSASLEFVMKLQGAEVIEVRAKAPPPTDTRSTTTISGAALERTRGKGISEALEEVPGVAKLESASGMAKPIIRGQFGRRLLILVDGVRHRAQEWGLDHAPEIDPFVAGALTVVRGASGVRYGPDAIGGAVLVDPPPLLDKGYAGEAHLVGITNGMGGAFAGRVQLAPVPGFAGQVEGSFKRLASPSTPDYALDNTGVSEWNLGGTVGFARGDHTLKLSYTHYQAELGVCSCLHVESADEFFAQLSRDRPVGSELYESDFEIERAKQAVQHDLAIASDEYTARDAGKLTTKVSFQHDRRREYDIVRENIAGPQFRFRLYTAETEVAFEHRPIHLTDHLHLRGTAGVTGMAQVHRYSGLQLVPDHQSFGGGIYALERLVGHDYELEAGVRYDLLTRTASLERIDYLRLVREGQLAMDACDADAEGADCDSRFHTISASVGGLYRFTEALVAKLDFSTASRPPNTDEQYLNGTSPTFPVLGLGKPDLGAETTYAASLTTAYRDDHVTAEISAFANYIADYIYFAPAIDAMGNPIFDVTIRGAFPRFVTRPIDAVFYGADGGVAFAPRPWLELGAQASLVRAKNRTDDGYLVFIPPDRARGSATLKAAKLPLGFSNGFISAAGTVVRRQDRYDLRADFASPPDAYFLLGAELGAETAFDHQTLKFALQGSNLLNERYRDYTSLLRYFADQPGWQLMLRLTLTFQSEKKQ